MRAYLDYLQDILDHGTRKADRTGTGTISVFGRQLRFDLQEGFPLVTTKKLHLRSIIHELLWFLSGDTNVRYLQENGVRIWNAWADADGNLGPVYGKQWRDFGGVDQVTNLVAALKANPNSRRHLVSAWNPAELPNMALPPCHYAYQCYVADGKLSFMWQQRSVDSFLGLPFNIASYALLAHMLAAQTGYDVGDLIFTGGDCHIYLNHLEQVQEQLAREPYPLPRLVLHRTPDSIFDYRFEDFEIVDYQHHPTIKAPIAV
ncbi:MAG: thymidylate synthase [Bacteroidota bacterium]